MPSTLSRILSSNASLVLENHTKHKNALCRQNSQFCSIKLGGVYSNHSVSEWLNTKCLEIERKGGFRYRDIVFNRETLEIGIGSVEKSRQCAPVNPT
jgi:hypothetical protein